MELQRTDEWWKKRLGKITASRIGDIMPGARGAYKDSREALAYSLAAEWLTSTPQNTFVTHSMQWGIDQEPNAKLAYTAKTDLEIREADFYQHPTIALSGGSPDGLIQENGLVEIKCPETHTHLKSLCEYYIKPQYIYQMQWCMECAGKTYCDFVSFDPRVKAPYNIWIYEVERDNEMIAKIKEEVLLFIDYLSEIKGKMLGSVC